MEKPQHRTRRTSDQMFPLVESYESSGQLQKEFCEQHGITIGTFHYWLKKYRKQFSTENAQSFQQITVFPEPPDHKRQDRSIVILTPSGMEIKIPLD